MKLQAESASANGPAMAMASAIFGLRAMFNLRM
jgi:hypothetical protein